VHGFLIVDVMVMKGAKVQEHGTSLNSYIGIVNRVEAIREEGIQSY
jgi:hypothetical protein